MMKKISLALAGILLLAVPALAQNMNIAKDQAKRSAGTAPPPAAGQPGPPKSAPIDPALAATLNSIARLQSGFMALGRAADTNAAAEQRTTLLNNLSGAAQAKKATPASVKKLAGDLMTGLTGKKLAAPDSQKLARSVHALFNAAHLSAPQQETLLADVKKILTDATVPAETVTAIVDDLKAVAAETK